MAAQHQGVEEESHRQARVRLWHLLRSSPCLGRARQTEPLCAATASSCRALYLGVPSASSPPRDGLQPIREKNSQTRFKGFMPRS